MEATAMSYREQNFKRMSYRKENVIRCQIRNQILRECQIRNFLLFKYVVDVASPIMVDCASKL
jgi:hypothetical protein